MTSYILFYLFSAPLKGIPSRNSLGSSISTFKTPNPANRSAGSVRNPTRPTIPGVRRDGGIKLLDIGEQPLGRDAKRKKRNQEETETKQKENDKTNGQDSSATPDYALGLTSMVPPSPAPAYSVPQTPGPYVSEPTTPKKESPSASKTPQTNSLIKMKSPNDEEPSQSTETSSPSTASSSTPKITPTISGSSVITSPQKTIQSNPVQVNSQVTPITIVPKQQTKQPSDTTVSSR